MALIIVIFLVAMILIGREENIKNEKEKIERREQERKIQNTRVESSGKPIEKEGDFATGVVKYIAISLVLTWVFYYAYQAESSDPWAMLIIVFGFGITFAIAFLVIIVKAFSPKDPDELSGNDAEYYDRLAETKERNRTGKENEKTEERQEEKESVKKSAETLSKKLSKIEARKEIQKKNNRNAMILFAISTGLVISEIFTPSISGFVVPLVLIPTACYNLSVNGKKHMFILSLILMCVSYAGSSWLNEIHWEVEKEQSAIRAQKEEKREEKFNNIKLDKSTVGIELVARDFYPTLTQAEKAEGIGYYWNEVCDFNQYYYTNDYSENKKQVYLQTPYIQKFVSSRNEISVGYNIWQGDGKVFVTCQLLPIKIGSLGI